MVFQSFGKVKETSAGREMSILKMCSGASFKVLIVLSLILGQNVIVLSAPLIAKPRLSVVDWNNYNYYEPNGPGTYAFGYDIDDSETDNVQFRNEERHANGTVTGSYGYVDPDGVARIAHYIADQRGYRVKFEDSPVKYLKPLLLPGIAHLSDLSDNSETAETKATNAISLGKIVTPDGPSYGFINSNPYPAFGSGNQNFNIGNNQFQRPFVQNQGLYNNNNYGNNPFISSQVDVSGYNPGQGSGNYEQKPQYPNNPDPIWPGFDISSLFENRIGDYPRRAYVKINNQYKQ